MSKVEEIHYDVTEDRACYIGGSDIPVIMGLSSFKTHFQLLLEKAGLEVDDFTGNKYTVYGQQLEPKIRAYINDVYSPYVPFVPNRTIVGDIRAHTDGFNGNCVLEIKTTSHIYGCVDDYKVYLVQLLKYMEVNAVDLGLLAVYERPEDFSTEFDEERLYLYHIRLDCYKELLAEINVELDRFRADLARLKENPLLTEQDFIPSAHELITLSNNVVAFEQQLAEIKAIEKKCKEAKAALFEEMTKHGVKSWTTPNGTKITRVDGIDGKVEIVTEFDITAFKEENPALYEMYLKEVQKKTAGRSGYVKITLPK